MRSRDADRAPKTLWKGQVSPLISHADSEAVLDFAVSLSRQMILAGANLERVDLDCEKIQTSYGLQDMSLFLLSTHMSVSCRDAHGLYLSRQVTIPPAGIHLSRLRSLNRLSFDVCRDLPAPATLRGRLEEAGKVREYPDFVMLIGQVLGMLCLCFLFGGSPRDMLCVLGITAILHYMMRLFSRPGINRMIVNFAHMFVSTCLAIFCVHSGLADSFSPWSSPSPC